VEPMLPAIGAKATFPQPYDSAHPSLPSALKAKGKSLATKNLMAMDACNGRSMSAIGAEVLEAYAKGRGLTADEFKAQLKARLSDPMFADEMLQMDEKIKNAGAVTTAAVSAAMTVSKGIDLASRYGQNSLAAGYNATFGFALPTVGYQWIPPDGPSLMKRIYDIHGCAVFECGAFNGDPHAGNIMLDETSGELGLVDYGQLYSLTEAERTIMAQLFMAFEYEDQEAAKAAMIDLGCQWTWFGYGEDKLKVGLSPMPMDKYWACLNREIGGYLGMAKCLKLFGFSTIDQMIGTKNFLTFQHIPGAYVAVVRMCKCLAGVADALGASFLNPGKMLVPAARAYLKKRGLPLRHPKAEGVAPPGYAMEEAPSIASDTLKSMGSMGTSAISSGSDLVNGVVGSLKVW